MANTYKLVIYCDTFPTLKNAKQFRINRSTNKMFIASSDKWAAWYKAASLQVNAWKAKQTLQFPLNRLSITIIIFFPNMRNHDIDGIASGVIDLLKEKRKKDKATGIVKKSGTGILYDDNWTILRPVTIDAGLSVLTPRIEVFLTPMDDLSIRTK